MAFFEGLNQTLDRGLEVSFQNRKLDESRRQFDEQYRLDVERFYAANNIANRTADLEARRIQELEKMGVSTRSVNRSVEGLNDAMAAVNDVAAARGSEELKQFRETADLRRRGLEADVVGKEANNVAVSTLNMKAMREELNAAFGQVAGPVLQILNANGGNLATTMNDPIAREIVLNALSTHPSSLAALREMSPRMHRTDPQVRIQPINKSGRTNYVITFNDVDGNRVAFSKNNRVVAEDPGEAVVPFQGENLLSIFLAHAAHTPGVQRAYREQLRDVLDPMFEGEYADTDMDVVTRVGLQDAQANTSDPSMRSRSSFSESAFGNRTAGLVGIEIGDARDEGLAPGNVEFQDRVATARSKASGRAAPFATAIRNEAAGNARIADNENAAIAATRRATDATRAEAEAEAVNRQRELDRVVGEGNIQEARYQRVRDLVDRDALVAIRQAGISVEDFVDDYMSTTGGDRQKALQLASADLAVNIAMVDEWLLGRKALRENYGFSADNYVDLPEAERVDLLRTIIDAQKDQDRTPWLVRLATLPWIGLGVPLAGAAKVGRGTPVGEFADDIIRNGTSSAAALARNISGKKADRPLLDRGHFLRRLSRQRGLQEALE